jgi:ABC-type Fe3+/spermidine/putrescine transport system ATPase subunit
MSLLVKKATYLYDTTASSRKGIEAVSFSLKQGERLSILGRSGSGKSTLLKAISGLLDLQSGDVFLGDEKIKGPNYSLIPGNKSIKYVAQDFDLKPDYTAYENIKDHLDYNYTPEKKERIVSKLIALFGLKDEAHNYPRQLSGGQQQRVAIAGCLAEMPKLLLLDEPFNDLDHATKTKTIGLLKNACNEFNTSIILVTHNYEECFIMSPQLMVMSKGKIAQKGRCEEVFYKPKNQSIAGLMGDFGILKAREIVAGKPLEQLRILRPSQLSLSYNSSSYDISATITSVDFMGNYYRCVAETEAGSSVVLHLQHAVKQEEKILLNITLA